MIRLVETVEKFGGMVGAAVVVALVGAWVGSDELELRAVGVGSVGLGVAQKLQSQKWHTPFGKLQNASASPAKVPPRRHERVAAASKLVTVRHLPAARLVV